MEHIFKLIPGNNKTDNCYFSKFNRLRITNSSNVILNIFLVNALNGNQISSSIISGKTKVFSVGEYSFVYVEHPEIKSEIYIKLIFE